MGQKNVDEQLIGKLARRLSSEDRRQLIKDIRYAPAWIGAIFRILAETEG